MSTWQCAWPFVPLLLTTAMTQCGGWAPSPASQFWLTWTINLLIGLGTLSAVVVALFKDYLLARFLSSRLELTLRSEIVGISWRTVPTSKGDEKRQERFYHLRLSNGRRWAPVHGVRVVLTRIERKNTSGTYEMIWGGETPMRWEHQEFVPVSRTVGPDGYIDLCYLTEGNGSVFLAPQYCSLSFPLQIRPHNPTILWFEARGDEADSPPRRVEVEWDGKWTDDDSDMATHLRVRALS